MPYFVEVLDTEKFSVAELVLGVTEGHWKIMDHIDQLWSIMLEFYNGDVEILPRYLVIKD